MVKKILGNIILFLLAIGICLGVAYAGSLYSTPAIPSWYDQLQKPDLTPPAWVFGPVWTILYCLMGLSLYLILQAGIRKKEVYFGLIFFIAQLVCNFTWTYLFFGLHSTFFGLIACIALWFLILLTIAQVSRFSIPAAAIQIPYFLWVTFAVLLSYLTMTMNPLSFALF